MSFHAETAGHASFWSNLSVKIRILCGFALVIAILAGVAVTAYTVFGSTLTNVETYVQRNGVSELAGEMEREASNLRRLARNFAFVASTPEDAKLAKNAAEALRKHLDEAKNTIKNPERATHVHTASEHFETYDKSFDRVVMIKLDQVKLIREGMDPAGVKYYAAVKSLLDQAAKAGNTALTRAANEALEHGLLARLYANQLVGRRDNSFAVKAKDEFKELHEVIPNLVASAKGTEMAATADEIKTLVPTYAFDFDRVAAINAELDTLINTTMAGEADKFGEAVEAVLKSADEDGNKIETETVSALQSTKSLMLTLAVGGVLLGCVIALWLGSSLARPIVRMTKAMKALADGDKGIVIPSLGQRDEIGQMASAVEIFKQNAIRVDQLNAEQEEQKKRAEREQRAAMNKLADNFEASVGKVIGTVTSAATELQAASSQMASTAHEASAKATAVAGASEEAAANVQTVAAAAEELSASIDEIKRQVQHASDSSLKAKNEADGATTTVRALSDNADKIGEIVSLINDIAAQTNLLALNATIEAARAGDAGKGFAVVASEVKGLANQTAKATEEIAVQIAAVQTGTKEAVTAISSVSNVIREVNDVSAAVASAVNEQTAATSEISRNVVQASAGTKDVSANIVVVGNAAKETGAAAQQIQSASSELSKQAEYLRAEVDRFMQQVRQN